MALIDRAGEGADPDAGSARQSPIISAEGGIGSGLPWLIAMIESPVGTREPFDGCKWPSPAEVILR